MNIIFLSIICFFILFFLSRKLVNQIYLILITLTGSKKLSMHLLSIIFLPGTLIHELSHLVMATILAVPAGKLTVVPEFDEQGNIRAGSVRIGKTDIFRGTLIGLAPVIVGLALFITVSYLGQVVYSSQDLFSYISQSINDKPRLVLLTLLFFQIGNTMFTSKSDLRDAIILTITITSIVTLLYFAGFRISVGFPSLLTNVPSIAFLLSIGLIFTTVIDIVCLIVLGCLSGVIKRIRRIYI